MSISTAQALDCLRSDDLIGLGMEADALRRRLHPERVVSYAVEVALPLEATPDQLEPLFRRAEHLDASSFILATEDPSALRLSTVEALLKTLQQQHPRAGRHGLTATAITALAANDLLQPPDVLHRLKAAGLDSLGGDDAFLLDESHRHQPDQPLCSAAEWLAVHRAAHALGLRSTASLTFGMGEDAGARVAHLEALAALQADTGSLAAFTLHAWTPRRPSLTHRTLDEATAVDFLKTLAVARLLLLSIPHVSADRAQGLKVTQMALRFGADDAGPVLTDEQSIRLAGPSNCATEEELRRLIRDAGFMPVQRDHLFTTLYLI